MNKIQKEVKALLEAWGYKPEVRIDRPSKGYVDICFHVNNGFDTMPTRHKDAIIMLAKGYLSEFYYGQDTQHVYLRNECKGLNPDDDRYDCLLHEIKSVDSNDREIGPEIFVNMGDRFKRFVNWKDVSSED